MDGGEHDDASAGPAGLDRTGRLCPGAVREPIVHEHDVHALAGELLRVGDGSGDADDLHVRLGRQDERKGVRQ